MRRPPASVVNAINVEWSGEILELEQEGAKWTLDLAHFQIPDIARRELGPGELAGIGLERGATIDLFIATFEPPWHAIHLRIDDWEHIQRVISKRTLEIVESTALGTNPLLALETMNRLQIAQAFEALCKTPTRRAISALCYHGAHHPEDLFAITAAVKAGGDAQAALIAELGESFEAAVEVAVQLLGEVGDDVAHAAIDKLHVWDRGVYAEAMHKIEARRVRPRHRRADALAQLAAMAPSWTWPPSPSAVAEPRWSLWELEALSLVHEPRDTPWWQLWSSELPPSARPFAQLAIVPGDDGSSTPRARITRAGQTLFEVPLDRDAVVERVRVTPLEPLGGVLVRITRDAGYRAAAVVEIGCLVARDAAWEALSPEDRRDVLYLAPADAGAALGAIVEALGYAAPISPA
jgi:hypothetical protein